MIDARVFIGAPLTFGDICKVYPPTVKDVLANPKFAQYLKILTYSQDDIKDELPKDLEKYPTPFEFLLGNCYNSEVFKKLTLEAFKQFIHEDIQFLFDDKKICIGKFSDVVQKIKSLDEIKFLTEENFFDFQNAIRMATGEKVQKPPEPPDPDEDPRITRMKAKARERDRIKAKKGTANGISLSATVTAICCMGIGITPLNIGEMSYAAIGPIMQMCQEKEKYDIDVRSLLAGADSKKVKPKYWIRNSD